MSAIRRDGAIVYAHLRFAPSHALLETFEKRATRHAYLRYGLRVDARHFMQTQLLPCAHPSRHQRGTAQSSAPSRVASVILLSDQFVPAMQC